MIDRRRYSGPIDRAKKLIVRQYLKTIGKDRRKEAKKLLDDHFFDIEHEAIVRPIQFARRPLQNLSTKDRAVYVLYKSTVFTLEEICSVLSLSDVTIRKIVKETFARHKEQESHPKIPNDQAGPTNP